MRGQNTLGQYNKAALDSYSQLGAQSIPQCDNDVQPRTTGLHESLAIILQKVTDANITLISVLQRVHGLSPEQGSDPKNPETPSVRQLGDRIHKELLSLEILVDGVANFVG